MMIIMKFRFYLFYMFAFCFGWDVTSAPTVEYSVRGIIKAIPKKGTSIHIKHEAIANYMPAMTMPFSAKTRDAFAEFEVGDAVSFMLYVTKNSSWIDHIQHIKTDLTKDSIHTISPSSSDRSIRELQALDIGDLLPNYRFIDHHENAFSLDDFRGQVLVLTFIYTRCPLPDFCPRMSHNFKIICSALEKNYIANDDIVFDNWHLLSLSFDPDFDSPKVLSSYAKAYSDDSKRWTFATGDRSEIDAITEQFGLKYNRSQISPTDWDHNLRTILIDPHGKIHKIYIGNLWTAETLIKDMKSIKSPQSQLNDN